MSDNPLKAVQGIDITGGIPSEIYVRIGRGGYEGDEYELATDVAKGVRAQCEAERVMLEKQLEAERRKVTLLHDATKVWLKHAVDRETSLGWIRHELRTRNVFQLDAEWKRGALAMLDDPKGDWHGLRASADGKRAGYPVVIFGGAKADVPLNQHAGASVAELVATGNRPCVIDLGGWMVGERTRFFIDFASTLFRALNQPLRLVIDECHNFAPQGKVLDPDAGKMLHWANRLASEGAGKGLVLLAASQRPQKVHKDFLTCAETLIAMRVIHKLDRDAVKDWIDGAGNPEKGREVLNTLASMARGEGWVWSPEAGFGPERVKFPLFKTYDSFAAPTGGKAADLKGWAEVDLDEVKVKLAAVVEESKANDPKELRLEISKLKKLLASKSFAPDDKAVERAVAAALVQRDREHKAAILGRDRIIDQLKGRMGKAERGLGAVLPLLHVNGCATPREIIPNPSSAPREKVETGAGKIASRKVVSPLPAREMNQGEIVYQPGKENCLPPDRKSFTQEVKEGDSDLTGRPQRFLDAAASLTTLGADVTRETVSAWVGVHPRGGSVGEVLKALEEAGYIELDRGRITVTDAGHAAAGHVDPAEAIDRAKSGLTSRQAKFFEVIVEAYPGEVTREQIAEQFDLHPRGGSLGEDLGRLAGRGLVEANRGRYRARDFLFAR